jgi:hypothetical protein
MVPHSTAMLPRLTGEWAALLPPDAIFAACGQSGSIGWRDRLLTPVTTVPRFLRQMLHGNTSCWSVSAARCRDRPRTTGGGLGLGPCSSMARAAPCPSPPALQDAFGQPAGPRLGGGVPVARLRDLLHAGPGVLLTRVIAPLLTHELAPGQPGHPR